VNSTSKKSFEVNFIEFHLTVAAVAFTDTPLMRKVAVAASALTPPTKNWRNKAATTIRVTFLICIE
jgi:hypothetical protein